MFSTTLTKCLWGELLFVSRSDVCTRYYSAMLFTTPWRTYTSIVTHMDLMTRTTTVPVAQRKSWSRSSVRNPVDSTWRYTKLKNVVGDILAVGVPSAVGALRRLLDGGFIDVGDDIAVRSVEGIVLRPGAPFVFRLETFRMRQSESAWRISRCSRKHLAISAHFHRSNCAQFSG